MAMPGISSCAGTVFSLLDRHQFMSLTTYRSSGEAVSTPVWFVNVGDKLYVMTLRSSGKVSRISHTPRVSIAPCDRTGLLLAASMQAVAHVVGTVEHAPADAALAQKYGEQKKMFDARLTDPSDRVYLAITSA